MKIGVYVGSFDPVHNGHIKIINYLINNFLDKVIVVATQDYWNKHIKCSLKDRINMLKFFENDKIIIDTKYNNCKYTYMILNKLKKEFKNDKIYLIIGADSIIKFDEWKNYKAILQYDIIIINRDDIDVMCYLNKLSKNNNFIITNKLKQIDISSSFIRKNINSSMINKLIDKKVYSYIINNNLYKEEEK